MTFKSNEDIIHIGRGSIDLSLPKAEWTHAAHFAAAIWLLSHPQMDAFAEMPEIIRAYNISTGVPNSDTDGYHETITIASLRAAEFVLNNAPTDQALYKTVNAVLASPFGSPAWILDYWTKDVLFSAEARRRWIDPDKAPMPF